MQVAQNKDADTLLIDTLKHFSVIIASAPERQFRRSPRPYSDLPGASLLTTASYPLTTFFRVLVRMVLAKLAFSRQTALFSCGGALQRLHFLQLGLWRPRHIQ